MPAVTITPADLEAIVPGIPEAKANAMIEDALAMAELVAPCIASDDLTDAKAKAAKAILRGAILRWHEAGQGGVSQQTALGFSQTMDTRQTRRGMFWPSEIEQLQKLCSAGEDDGKAWAYDTLGTSGVRHADICAVNFGALYCSCGAVLTGMAPLWED
ncbi:hypothetical protein BN970_01367 [Mycolicibacterium conceptionense]|uniref:Head-to-tail adaptor n=1 Tax=Mycolicibacterium conceptionense TaxID=451644 RepID=A0A0U1D394_9MYCO|nr:hypothetical protein [Mycolicibacterium conceptionense]ORV20962.1 hypothetical protein AWB98_01295 [Mycolicibacterium conceptionense]CQD07264.1 hypothetical protein BN970_01367 [Mycolicibacterium conceptionense]